MKTLPVTPFLRNVLLADAVASGGVAVLQLALPGRLAELSGLPHAILVATGVFLLGYVLLLVLMARARVLWTPLLAFVVLGNISWAAGCALLAANLSPGPVGLAFLAMHGVTVLLFAWLELQCLRAPVPMRNAPAHTG